MASAPAPSPHDVRPRAARPRRADGLAGAWLSLEELGALPFFQGTKRNFKLKLSANLEAPPGAPEPGIKAAVRREYAAGEMICRAGDYGSTAFLLLEGRATAACGEGGGGGAGVPGRKARSLAALKRIFRRRHAARAEEAPAAWQVGEVSRYAAMQTERRPAPISLGPGDVFGIDTCINFYPREATVVADEPCVVVEMLRSVLDTVREVGSQGEATETAYRTQAIRTTLERSPLLEHLAAEQIAALAASASLLTPDADEVRDAVVYAEGAPAEALFLVRAGTIKLARTKQERELVFAYLGRDAVFGLEALLPHRRRARVLLRCTSHPGELPEIPLDGVVTVGRSAACDLRLPADNRAVGRRHCRFEERDGELYVIDLDSTNYTLLNGERVHETLVTAGDVVTVVDYTFQLVAQPLEDATTPATAVRLATAAGLDNFEVVKVPVAALLALAADDPQLLDHAVAIARTLEARTRTRAAADRSVVAELVDLGLQNSQNVLLIDLERCTRCDECVRACSDAHDGIARFTRDGPRVGKYLVTMACRSCTDPKCMIGCPVGSIRRTDSLEIQIEDWCIGCERCANQCPFGNINMVELAALRSPPPERPSVSQRATVCDLCAGYQGPSCVYACPHDAAIRVEPSAFLSAADLR